MLFTLSSPLYYSSHDEEERRIGTIFNLSGLSMEEEEIEKAVLAYLKKKGFKQTELALQEEQQSKNSSVTLKTDPDVAKHILSFTESENVPARYHEGYSKLRSWAYSSLDLYKHELLRVLYPEMEFAHSLRQSKVNIKICQNGDDPLMHEISVSPGQPSSISDDAEVVTLIGNSQDNAKQINQKEILWGVSQESLSTSFLLALWTSGQVLGHHDCAPCDLPIKDSNLLLEDSLEDRLEKASALLSDSEKVEGENKDGDVEEGKRKIGEGGKQGNSTKKLKKDKNVSATGKSVRSENNTVSTAPRVKPELTLPVMSAEVENSILEDLRNRVQLSSQALPSISFYTFINTHNSLNCSSISQDGSLVVGGFSDSSLKVWDMSKIGWPTEATNVQGENGSVPSEQFLSSEDGKRSYTLFQGHAGPVYAATFSPLGDFILSSSSDSTIRLWSTKLNANLVCYKGHNYPVWDVQVNI
ncbi:hypothetical protein ACLOJK_040972 [Asimina triloba]